LTTLGLFRPGAPGVVSGGGRGLPVGLLHEHLADASAVPPEEVCAFGEVQAHFSRWGRSRDGQVED